jgi:hypothetical protein
MKRWTLAEITINTPQEKPDQQPQANVTRIRAGSQWKIPGSTFLKALGATDIAHSVDQYNASARKAGEYYKVTPLPGNQNQKEPDASNDTDETGLQFPEIKYPEDPSVPGTSTTRIHEFIESFEKACKKELSHFPIVETVEFQSKSQRYQGGIPW